MSMLRYDHVKISEALANDSEVCLLRILSGVHVSNYSATLPDDIKNIYYITAAWKYLRHGRCTKETIVGALSQYPSDHMTIYGVGGVPTKLPLNHAVDYVINVMLQPILTPTEDKEFKVLLELAGKSGGL
ncbi:hypothetical protein [Vibrio parahaemolyticus]|uniref:hypothetical protein n=1 Tax=Vibrio parahaemolyticus TaxID=670 RepID=UPI00084B887B|nr:hypothetical protein [Vibrio parahaemolyticus]OEB32247.1 hypothetical protein BBM78_13040 [Vibrio parahaemolyticus]HCG9599741.1 hypothetical protein [Vibrio parahaemolyticus]HCH0109096.1 hypothetical protein [Vibrio parahaemolyticus]HCH0124308.1 hypothetical protein [Vibrio parahaemolyticus]HCH0227990.1 hypothetical protein [Vibrio parahaemolyticus]